LFGYRNRTRIKARAGAACEDDPFSVFRRAHVMLELGICF
jgi:hypothetical protein